MTVNLGLRYEYGPPIAEDHNKFGNFDPSIPSGMMQQTGDKALYSTSKRNVGPRLGVSWDVTGKGTTVVRAGWQRRLRRHPYSQHRRERVRRGSGLGSHGVWPDYCSPTVDPHGQPCSTPANGLVTVPSPGTDASSVATLSNNCTIGANHIGSNNPVCSQINWTQNVPVFPTALNCGDGLAQITVGATLVTPTPCSIAIFPNHQRTAYITTWTAAVQHAFGGDLSLNVAYVGNHLTGAFMEQDLNLNLSVGFATTLAQSNAALGVGSGGGPSTYLGPCKNMANGCPIAGITSAISRWPYNSIFPCLGTSSNTDRADGQTTMPCRLP